jgi:hypothetical protein
MSFVFILVLLSFIDTGLNKITDNEAKATPAIQGLTETKDWRNYTSSLGFTMQIPEDYIVKIKKDPRLLGLDLVVQSPSKPSILFMATNTTQYSNNVKDEILLTENEYLYTLSDGFYNATSQGLSSTKWNVSGQQAGSFILSVADNQGDLPITKNEIIVTLHGGNRLIFTFSTPTEIFDNPAVQSIKDKIINSIRWINDGSNSSRTAL